MNKAEVAKALQANKEEIAKTDRALKKATDLRAPKGAKSAAIRLRRVLRNVRKNLYDRRKFLKNRAEALERTGAQAAVTWAKKQNGVTETPVNSNWGEPVEDWIKYTGYGGPVPWCGCFVAVACVREGGAKIDSRIRLGYAGYIVDDARNGANGLHAVAFDNAKGGDIFTIGSSHIGLVTGRDGDELLTVEGNTSPSDSGSQYNGGCVAIKRRHRSIVTVVARPDYA